jgi:hypothetical protein
LLSLEPRPRFAPAIAAAAFDSADNQYIVTTADFVSNAKAYRISASSGARLDSISIGISPEAVLIWRPRVTRIEPEVIEMALVYPNPVQDWVQVPKELSGLSETVTLCNTAGVRYSSIVLEGRLQTSGLPPGLYILTVQTPKSRHVYRFSKS